MKRYWYTFFLMFSIAVTAAGMGAGAVYGEYKKDTDIAAEIVMEDEEQVERETQNTETDAMKPQEVLTQTEPVSGQEKLFPEEFEGVLFIGDSRTVGLHEYGQLEKADVFADSGMSVFNVWQKEIDVSGEKMTLEQLLSKKSYKMIHFMLGINELGYPTDGIVKNYEAAVKKIKELQQDARIVLGANMHVTAEKSSASAIYNNQKINELNEKIETISKEQDCRYIDINEIFDDADGNLEKEYSADGSHVLGKYYADWVLWFQEK